MEEFKKEFKKLWDFNRSVIFAVICLAVAVTGVMCFVLILAVAK